MQTIDTTSAMLPSQYKPNNVIRRTWLLLLFLSITLLVVVLSTGSCDHSETSCKSIGTTSGLAGLGCIFSICSFALYHLWQIDKIKDWELARYGASLSSALFLSSTANVAIIGAIEGSIYFLSWGFFWLSLYLCLRHIDVFTLQAKSSQDEHDAATAPYSRSSSRCSTGSGDMDLHDDNPSPAILPSQLDLESTNIQRSSKKYTRSSSFGFSFSDLDGLSPECMTALGVLPNSSADADVPKLKSRHSDGARYAQSKRSDHKSNEMVQREIV
jgi:hypothetical protein